MKIKTSLTAIAAAATLVCGVAHASLINVGGVMWDQDSPFDLQANANLFEQVVLNDGEELKGYGIITAINQQSTFCAAANCELTFTFSNYILNGSIAPPAFPATSPFSFTGGVFNFYVGAAGSATPGDVSSYSDGTLWLTLSGADPFSIGTLFGTTTIQVPGGGIAGQGTGYLDVVQNGALAAVYFDTNSVFGADLSYTSSFQPLNAPLPDGMTHFGTANIRGNSVPEPGALALFGLGLAGFGLVRRNKKSV